MAALDPDWYLLQLSFMFLDFCLEFFYGKVQVLQMGSILAGGASGALIHHSPGCYVWQCSAPTDTDGAKCTVAREICTYPVVTKVRE
jgi:hypothetical protein